MRCTECSMPVRPIVAVDIDGTLSEYHFSLAEFACNYHDRPLPRESWGGLGNFEEYLGLTQAEYREAKLAYRQGGYKRIAPLQSGAIMFMAEMQMLGVEVWITTTRPWSRLDNVDPDTKFWLHRHGIVYDHLLFDDNKYQKLSTIVDHQRVWAVVDDLPDMCSEAEQYLPGALTLMIERPHNYDTRQGHLTVPTLMDAARAIRHMAQSMEAGENI